MEEVLDVVNFTNFHMRRLKNFICKSIHKIFSDSVIIFDKTFEQNHQDLRKVSKNLLIALTH